MNAVSPNQAAALATTALCSSNPDAELLATIDSFRASQKARHEEWDALNRLPKRHPEFKQRWAAFSATVDRVSRTEKLIARTAALTLAGAAAKAKLGFDMLGGDDPQGDDLLHDDGGHCRMWAVAAQGTRGLLRLIGERCGSSWDEPDAELIDLCDRALAAANGSDRTSSRCLTLLVGDPTWSALHEAACLEWRTFIDLAGRAARIPATTVSGMRAKAAVALRAIPLSDHEDIPEAVSLLADIAGVQPPPSAWAVLGDEQQIEASQLREAAGDAATDVGERV